MNRLVCGNLILIMFLFTIFNCFVLAEDEQIKLEGKTNHFQYDKQRKSDKSILIPKNNHKSIKSETKIQGFGDQKNKVNEECSELSVQGDPRVPVNPWDPFGIDPKE